MSDANGSDVSLAELQQRLVTFTEQLQSIHKILQTDPENTEFLNIASDLVEVIKLTKEMIDLRLGSAQTSAPSTDESSVTATAAVPSEGEAAELEFTPGTICEAQSKGVWFPVFIESLTARDTYNVHYLGFGNKEEVPASSLRAVAPVASPGELPARDAIAVGFMCSAKYYVDGQYYTAAVTAVTAHGYQVLFDGYGNSEEVPYEYMRPLATDQLTTQATPTATVSSSQATASSSVASAVVVKSVETVVKKAIAVPEHLVVLPTDTEAEKERKRKRLKTIQKLNKQIEVENAHNVKQHDWKSFQQKAVKKHVRGSGVLSKRGTSMFASPDSVQGRVGVVGSGQGMTQFEDTRKKLKKSHLESAPRL